MCVNVKKTNVMSVRGIRKKANKLNIQIKLKFRELEVVT